MKLFAYLFSACLIFLTQTPASRAANYVDSHGREWMRIDDTFGFAGEIPSRCSPNCSGLIKQDIINLNNVITSSQIISLDGWVHASKDEAQELMNSTGLLSLGISQQFVTTYSYSGSVYASTSTKDPQGRPYIAYDFMSHAMVTLNYGSGFVVENPGTRVGALLYRMRAQPKSCVFNGAEVKHGASINAFIASRVPYNLTCQSEARVCNDGVLSGTYLATSCSVIAPLNCTYNGKEVLHGQSVSGFSALTATSLGTYGSFCTNVSRICINGALNGVLYPSCKQTVLDPKRCEIKKGVIKCKT